MTDILTIFRKELMETTGDRQSVRGVLLQAGIITLLTGIVVPWLNPSIWKNVSTLLMLYAIFPSTLAATIAADAFAGERERRTLESLLATPLGDRAIYLGKVATALFFVICVAAISLFAGIATGVVRGQLPEYFPPLLFVAVPGGALAGALMVAAVTMAISTRSAVARSAQQMGSFSTYVFAGLTVSAIRLLGKRLDWVAILEADVCLFVLGCIGLTIGMCRFRRDRFFEGT